MRSLFVMDPLHRIQVAGDSTYVTMAECSRRGFEVAMCTPEQLYGIDGQAWAHTTEVRTDDIAPFFHVGASADRALGEFDVVWMRKDPPFDMDYIFATYLLAMAPPETLVVNGPAGLKLFNEKMWAMEQFSRFQPTSLVTQHHDRIKRFVEEAPGRVVLKPWDGNGGRGVLITASGDRNLNSMIEVLTGEGRHYVIAQHYIEGVERGDKRILLFGGEPVGAMLRVPTSSDFRANMHVGAGVEPCALDARDREICAALRPELERWGMFFVGIDVIDGFLTEINVTSPTGIREMNAMYDQRLESDLVDCVFRARGRQT